MRLLPALVLLCAAACNPASQYNRGMDMSYHPSGKAEGGERLVNSAVELKVDADQQKVKDAGGVYLGELEVVAQKTAQFEGTQGAQGLAGRISLEAANRGATHFYLASSDIEQGFQRNTGVVQTQFASGSSEQVARIRARYVLFRIEQDSWAKLPKEFQPTTPVKAVAAPAPGSSAPPQG